MNADSLIRCEHYNGTYKASFCALRQTTTEQATHAGNKASKGGRVKWREIRTYVPMHLAYCASGQCEQGRAVLVALGMKAATVTPPPKKKPCKACGEWMSKRVRESRTSYEARQFCDSDCRTKENARVKAASSVPGAKRSYRRAG